MTALNILNRSRAWLIWATDKPRLLWGLMGALVAAALVLLWGSELAFRSYGFSLQVLGVFIAGREIFSNERLFQQPRLRDHLAKWWASRPGTGIHLRANGAVVTATGGNVRVRQRAPAVDGDSLEAQVSKLWRNIDFLTAELDALATQIDRNKNEFDSALKVERESRLAEHKKLEVTIKEVAVGSAFLAYFGFLLVLLGSAITTWSQEAHRWAQ